MQNKILLINTFPSSWKKRREEIKTNMPPGILAIATWLAKNSNFEVKIIDCLIEKDYMKLIEEEIKKRDVFLAGVSVMSPCLPNAMEVTRLIDKLDSSIKIVWGGVHCKLYPEQTISNSLIDFVVYNEGEKPFLNLANAINNDKSVKKIKGIFYKKDGEIFKTEPESQIDLNELGILRYDLLNPSIFDNKSVTISSSRGCPHRCTFCINIVTKDTRWRAMTPENVLREIQYLKDKYDVRSIGFLDDCFFVNKQRAEKIADLLISKKLKFNFIAASRADYFTKGIVTKELLQKWKKCGLTSVSLGIEFGSQKMRDYIKKDINEDDVFNAVKILKSVGVGGVYAFMTGFPDETKEDTLATIDLIRRMSALDQGVIIKKENNKVHSWIDRLRIAGPQVYRPYPGGELYDSLVRNYKWKSPETLEKWEEYFLENTRYQIEDYPWIKLDPNLYASLQFYVKSGKANFRTFIQKLTLPYNLKFKVMYTFFYPISKIRLYFNFFNFPIEYIIAKKFRLIDELET